ncbi:hypothetical protein CWI38_1063p0040 [Hamiltosporidium tvaerminnensis]|uniref:Homologous recombination OB-fold protein OB-fold domain-containing protein n=1 Tax=Hamiltosporidium tvaerminnensis TaxID=1176355 RepID=A0A4Q9LVT5_9MICR|nr:hypothetical protein CWI38_1063p0040 [Hamiltosporidium tvaerminnensis]
MNTIDELINKIRSKKIKKEETTGDIVNKTTGDIVSKTTTDTNTSISNTNTNISNTNTSTNIDTNDITDTLHKYKESQDIEIITSQVYPTTHTTTDFKNLQSIKNKIQDFIEIKEIKETEKYKIENYLISIVKRIIKYDNIVCGIELIDETGEIKGSLFCETVHIFDIKIGSIVVIENFSLWKINETHLNISSENIKEVI